MPSKTLNIVALALASLSAACTSSEIVLPGMDPNAAAGASGSDPFKPFQPRQDSPPPIMPDFGFTGAGGTAFAPATGGAGGAADTGACMGTMPAPAGMPAPPLFKLDLGASVTSQDRAPRPISGGTLLVLRDGSAAVAADSDRDRVYVVDLATRAVRATVALDSGDEPGRLIEDGAGLVHVALRSGGAVVKIDPATAEVKSRQAVCAAPRGLAYEAARDLVHVACAEGLIVSLRAKSGGVFRTVPIDRDARDVILGRDGGLRVSTFRRAEALSLDVDGKEAARSHPLPVMRFNGPTPMPQPASAAVAWRMVPAGAGAVMLHQRGVDGPLSPTPGGYAGGGRGCGGIVESDVTVVAPDGSMGASAGIQLATLAVDVAVSPDGSQVAIVSAGNAHTPMPQLQIVSFANVQTGSPCIGAGAPGMGAMDGQLVAVAYSPEGTVVAQSREPAQLLTSDGKAAISLSQDLSPDSGHMIFHANSGSGIACASCHPEGGEDGRTWNFACLGPRRTQSLRGGLTPTAPFHWDGDMTSFPKLVHEVFVGRMAGPQTNDIQDAALLHWLDRVPELPVPAVRDAGAVERGRALFNGAASQCATCHTGPMLTNNATVDVGTGHPLQVPTLRGVGWRAPFLHDGRAATLVDRFAMGGGDKHGHTSQLSTDDIKDLAAFLDTL